MDAGTLAMAQQGGMDVARRINTTWTVLTALCVYLMHGGFGFFEAGMTRRRSTVTTLTHNLVVLALTALVYWAVGFGLMYGQGSVLFGTHGFFPTLLPSTAGDFPELLKKPVPLVVAFAFALSFADTPATLVAGSGAERLKLSGFIVFSILIGALVFPLVGRATLGGGLLAQMSVPFYDTGSVALQLSGGLCALVVCSQLGPRQGRFNPDGSANRMPSSSMPLVFLGAFILWMGFLAFNAGLMMEVNSAIALIVVNSVLASLGGAPVALGMARLLRGKISLRAGLMGMLTAVVAVTSVSPVVEPWAALVTGIVAGALTVPCIALVARLGLDDPTEYLTMNVMGGLWGAAAVGLFASPEVARRFGAVRIPQPGLVYGGWQQMVSQSIGVLAVVAFVVPVMWVATLVVKRLGMLRVSAREEKEGSDIASSGEEAYEGFAWAPEGQEGDQPRTETSKDRESRRSEPEDQAAGQVAGARAAGSASS